METGSGSCLEAGKKGAHSPHAPRSRRIGGLGTAFRRVLVCFGRRRQATYHPQSASHLLQQPVEIILEIIGYLDPVASAAFSLSCKALWAAVAHPTRLLAADQERLLLLMERDPTVGNGWYYCHVCVRLHPHLEESQYAHLRIGMSLLLRFRSAALDPPVRNIKTGGGRRRSRHFCPPCCSRTRFCHGHGRPIMNRHFYGPPVGLSLDWLNTHDRKQESSRSVIKLETREARSINDELFLTVKHELFPASYRISPETFRKKIDRMHISICSHVYSLTRWDGSSDAPTEERPGIPELGKRVGPLMFIPCRNIQRSCTQCPMDYEITIEFKEIRDGRPGRNKNNNHGWVITVISYFRLGGFRTAWTSDWTSYGCRADAPGSVQQKWLSAGGD